MENVLRHISVWRNMVSYFYFWCWSLEWSLSVALLSLTARLDSFRQQQLRFVSWGAASSRLAWSDSVKTINFYICIPLRLPLSTLLLVRSINLLILSPDPMLAGTPFSMSFKMHFSKAKAATLKKNPCTFSPEYKKEKKIFYGGFLHSFRSMCLCCHIACAI